MHRRRWTHPQRQNPAAIDDVIGNGWRNDIHELENLTTYLDDKEVLNQFYQVKKTAKQRLADYIKGNNRREVSTDAIFDVRETSSTLTNVNCLTFFISSNFYGNLKITR